MICETCKNDFTHLLNERIKMILSNRDAGEYPDGVAESHCFHLMELQEQLKRPTE